MTGDLAFPAIKIAMTDLSPPQLTTPGLIATGPPALLLGDPTRRPIANMTPILAGLAVALPPGAKPLPTTATDTGVLVPPAAGS